MSSMYDDEEGQEGVIRRRFVLCDSLQQIPPDGLIRTWGNCCQFFVLCCSCRHKYGIGGHEDDVTVCHHFRLIFASSSPTALAAIMASRAPRLALGWLWAPGGSMLFLSPPTWTEDRGEQARVQSCWLLYRDCD